MSHDVTATLEATLTTELARMYEEVATHPEGDHHFYTGRKSIVNDAQALGQLTWSV